MKKSIAVLVNLMPLSSKIQSQEEIQNVLLMAMSFQKGKQRVQSLQAEFSIVFLVPLCLQWSLHLEFVPKQGIIL